MDIKKEDTLDDLGIEPTPVISHFTNTPEKLYDGISIQKGDKKNNDTASIRSVMCNDCGKFLKNAAGLKIHQRFCKKAETKSNTSETIIDKEKRPEELVSSSHALPCD